MAAIALRTSPHYDTTCQSFILVFGAVSRRGISVSFSSLVCILSLCGGGSMATKMVVFPVAGRRWSFSALPPSGPVVGKYSSVKTLSQLWQRLRSLPKLTDRAELMEQFASTKMQDKWAELGAQPSESIRHRIYSVGQKLLNRLPAEEHVLKAISKDTRKVELVFPASLNPRLVRRRVRHLAHYGTIYHRKLMYGSISLLPCTVLLGILPMPNIVFFWNLFRAHSHWRAWQGSTRLKMLVTDSETEASIAELDNQRTESAQTDLRDKPHKGVSDLQMSVSSQKPPWVFMPSTELESLVKPAEVMSGVIQPSTISAICKTFGLESSQVETWLRGQSL